MRDLVQPPPMASADPFTRPAATPRGVRVRAQVLTVDARLAMLRTFDARQCQQALRVADVQLAVRRALRRRLQVLEIDPDMPGARHA